MKKLSVILLVSLYLVITNGFALNVHYCMGKVSSVELDSFGKTPCGSCGKKDAANSCCRTSMKFFKVRTSHIAATALQLFNPFQQVLAVFPGDMKIITCPASSVLVSEQPHAPPPPPDRPMYLLNGVFLI